MTSIDSPFYGTEKLNEQESSVANRAPIFALLGAVFTDRQHDDHSRGGLGLSGSMSAATLICRGSFLLDSPQL